MNSIKVRMAVPEDAASLLEIYRPYVSETAITFEYIPPTVEEFAQRIRSTLQKFPYIVAEQDEKIMGYAYASAFKDRAAYDWAVETSIYVSRSFSRIGCGKVLYKALEQLLKVQNITNLNACIAYTPCKDPYLTNGSIAFHARLGYKPVGTFHQCGFKFNHWYDMIWMEKMIGTHSTSPNPVIPISKIDLSSILS